jgi:cytochrome P450
MLDFDLFLGKRQCLGESLARMNTFLAITFLLQKFTFSKIPGVTYDLRPKPWTQMIHFPQRYRLIITPRYQH